MPGRRQSLEIFSLDRDEVVRAIVATGRTTYRFALKAIYPLIDRLDIQRKIQNPRFYDRLERDIINGCLMPPITLAFIAKARTRLTSAARMHAYLTTNISNGFVLDGIQRLSTLHRASQDPGKKLPMTQSLFLNIIVCDSMDSLLYRMITLNNGQRPMTTRHQIEILAANTFDFETDGIELATEKAGIRRAPGIFSEADFVLGYMAFLSESTTIDSQKLIQEKLDDLLAARILEHPPVRGRLEFASVIALISELSAQSDVDKWFKVTNNLIGFCAGIPKGYQTIRGLTTTGFATFIASLESAFRSFDVSKIKLGRARRSAVEYAIKNASDLVDETPDHITEKLVNVLE